MIAVAQFPTLLRFPLGGAQEELKRVTRMFRAPMGNGVFAQPMGGVASTTTNWWEAGGATGCVAAYQAKGTADYATSKVNLANPGTYNAFEGNAPTFNAATGWHFDTQYLRTGVVPSVSGVWSMFIQYSNLTPSGGFDSMIGSYQDTGATGNFLIQYSSTRMIAYNSDVNRGAHNTPPLSSGNYGFAGLNVYRNGVAESNTIPSVAGTMREVYIGVLNYNNGSSVIQYTNFYVVAAAIYNNTLSTEQALALATAMAAL